MVNSFNYCSLHSLHSHSGPDGGHREKSSALDQCQVNLPLAAAFSSSSFLYIEKHGQNQREKGGQILTIKLIEHEREWTACVSYFSLNACDDAPSQPLLFSSHLHPHPFLSWYGLVPKILGAITTKMVRRHHSMLPLAGYCNGRSNKEVEFASFPSPPSHTKFNSINPPPFLLALVLRICCACALTHLVFIY